MKVSKFIDDKYHATTGEYKLSKMLEKLDTLDISKEKKLEYSMLFEKAFELGYAAAKEDTGQQVIEEIQKLSEMTPEQLKDYFSLYNACIDVLNSYDELKKK